jgi:F-type H+-transporting ATPase subunit a
MEHHKTLFELIPGLSIFPVHIIAAIFVCLVIWLVAAVFYIQVRRISSAELAVPPTGFGIRNLLELVTEFVLGLIENIAGEKGRKFVPIIGTTFLFILISNLMGLVPGLAPATDNVNTNAACAIVVFFSTYYFGVKEHGLAYFKKFAGPVWWLAVLFIPIEIISHMIRPVSLTLRLYGNIYGDHQVLSIFSNLIPILVPIPFLALGALVSIIQALVFALLSIVYIGEAISHDH